MILKVNLENGCVILYRTSKSYTTAYSKATECRYKHTAKPQRKSHAEFRDADIIEM